MISFPFVELIEKAIAWLKRQSPYYKAFLVMCQMDALISFIVFRDSLKMIVSYLVVAIVLGYPLIVLDIKWLEKHKNEKTG